MIGTESTSSSSIKIMGDSNLCLGHGVRVARDKKFKTIIDSRQNIPDENLRVLIKKGPKSVETSLKELEENYARKPEWKVIENGGVLSVPLEEFRMMKPPKPDRSGNIKFQEN